MATIVTNYHSLGGQILMERTAGRHGHDYLPDALGTVTCTASPVDEGIVSFSRHFAYGLRNAWASTVPQPGFGWVGAWGYRRTATQRGEGYVRARHYESHEGRWVTVDPFWPDEHSTSYSSNRPTTASDPSGMVSGCLTCYAGSEGFRGHSTFCGKVFTEKRECSPTAAALGGAIGQGWRCGAKVKCCVVIGSEKKCQTFTIEDSGATKEPILDLGCCWAKNNGWLGNNNGRISAVCTLVKQGAGDCPGPPRKWHHLPGPC